MLILGNAKPSRTDYERGVARNESADGKPTDHESGLRRLIPAPVECQSPFPLPPSPLGSSGECAAHLMCDLVVSHEAAPEPLPAPALPMTAELEVLLGVLDKESPSTTPVRRKARPTTGSCQSAFSRDLPPRAGSALPAGGGGRRTHPATPRPGWRAGTSSAGTTPPRAPPGPGGGGNRARQ